MTAEKRAKKRNDEAHETFRLELLSKLQADTETFPDRDSALAFAAHLLEEVVELQLEAKTLWSMLTAIHRTQFLLDWIADPKLVPGMEKFFSSPKDAASFVQRVQKNPEEFLHRLEAIGGINDETGTYKRLIEAAKRQARSQSARTAATALHHAGEKGETKTVIKDCWKDWKKRPPLYATKAAFARSMMEKYPGMFKTETTIVRWVTNWEDAKA